MFLLSALLALGRSFGDELHVIAAEVMFRNIGDSITNVFKNTSAIISEVVDRPSVIGAWISYVERPPFNIDAFNHWRFEQTPINDEHLNITAHTNEDSLAATYQQLIPVLTGTGDAWTFNFAVKSWFGILVDGFSPLHNAELFSSDFPDGDNSGRRFPVKFNGNEMSLYDLWETGCGKYSLKLPFTADQWASIDQKVTDIMQRHTFSHFHRDYDFEKYREQAYNLSRVKVYKNLKSGADITEEYVKQCQDICEEMAAHAGYFAGAHFKDSGFVIPPRVIEERQPMAKSEAIAWLIFCFLLPAAFYVISDLLRPQPTSQIEPLILSR